MKSFWKPLLLTSAAFGIGIVLVSGAKESFAQKSESGKVQRVHSVIVQRQNIVRSVEMPGTVEGFKTVELYSKIGGFLKDISVDIGDEVKELISIASLRGRLTRPNIKIGLCGEHGANPDNIRFCMEAGLNYVSCSPYAIPLAKLGVAQINIEKMEKEEE